MQAREAKDMVRKQTGIIYDRCMTEHKCIWDPNYPECPERFTRVLERYGVIEIYIMFAIHLL
jgi:histone deacetylase 6